LFYFYFLQLFSKDDISTNYSLVTVYPRQELTEELNSIILKELNLSPSGTIMVKFNEVGD